MFKTSHFCITATSKTPTWTKGQHVKLFIKVWDESGKEDFLDIFPQETIVEVRNRSDFPVCIQIRI